MKKPTVNSIGVIGIGIMGSAISTRLLECDQHLTVYDLNAAYVQPMVDLGAHEASSAGEVARPAP